MSIHFLVLLGYKFIFNHKGDKGLRMLDIFERLNKGEHLSKRDLTSYYGVGEKTIQRDIDDIRNYLADKHGYEPDATVKYNRGQNYYYEAPCNLVRQRKEISASTAKYAQLAETAIADNDNTRETVHCLVEAAANAKGQTALRQIMEQLNALSVADQSQVTALLAAKVQPESDQRQVQLDAEIEREKQAQDAKIIVTDPYNEERAAASGYEREKPRGFVCFK